MPELGSPLPFEIFAGKPTFILGPNGTGKSALLHNINNQLTGQSVYLPGSRSLHFDYENLSLTPASRRQLTANLQANDRSPDTRWRPLLGTSRNEKAIHDLQNAESSFGADEVRRIRLEGAASPAIEELIASSTPFEKLNRLLEQANLSIRLLLVNGEARIQKGSDVYSYAKLSDGERSALLLASEVLTAEPRAIFVIDEPELHLHPSIVIPLLRSVVAARNDCGFLVSTHELGLPASIDSASIIFVRRCVLRDNDFRDWELDVVSNSNLIPENLRLDVLGARRKLLFIEGGSNSLDAPLYALLFPETSIATREGCSEVSRAVKGLRSVPELHHVIAFGLVDNDGMLPDKISKHEAENVYPLACFAVESLYYDLEVQKVLAVRQAKNLQTSELTLLENAKRDALAALSHADVAENLVSKVSLQKIREDILAKLPKKQDLVGGGTSPITISAQSPYLSELARFNTYVQSADLKVLIEKYPVRESGALSAIAKGLRFLDRHDYEKAALTAISETEALKLHLKGKMANLGLALNA